MKKNLEKALENIGGCYVASEGNNLMSSQYYGDDYDIIEKHLKAFEIVQTKEVLIHIFKFASKLITLKNKSDEEGCDLYNKEAMHKASELTLEEFKLLKEVLM